MSRKITFKGDGKEITFQKFNPYHDSRGRFTSANGATSFTYAPGKSKAHDKAIQRQKAQAEADDAGLYSLRVHDTDGSVYEYEEGDMDRIRSIAGESANQGLKMEVFAHPVDREAGIGRKDIPIDLNGKVKI